MASIDLPVNQQFLEDAINREYGSKVRIVGHRNEVIGEGKGFLSVVTKTTLDYENNASNVPNCFIVKQPTLDKLKTFEAMANFAIEDLREAHNREVIAYTYFNSHGKPPLPLPRCIYHEAITDEGTGLLILENIAGQSIHFGNDATIAQVKALAGMIGEVQAFGIRNKYDGVIEPMAFSPFDNLLPVFKGFAKALREKHPDVFNVSDSQLSKIEQDTNETSAYLKGKKESPYTPVVCLGDMQPNNTIWKTNNDGSLSSEIAASIDFQILHKGLPGYDLASAVTLTVDPQLFERHADEIFHHYYTVLMDKAGDAVVPTLDEVKETFNRASRLYSLFGVAMAPDEEQVRKMTGISEERFKEMFRRCAKIMNDYV